MRRSPAIAHRFFTVLALVLLFLSSAREARAERELIVPFHEGGHVVLDQLAGLRLSTTGVSYSSPVGIMTRSEGDVSTTSLWFAPSGDFFVTDHLSIGGLIEVNHSWGTVESGGQSIDLPGTTSLTFLPRIGFYAPLTDRIGIWGRAGVGWTRTEQVSFLSAGSAPTTDTFQSLILDVDATVVYRFTEVFFMKAGPELGVTFGGRRESSTGGVSTGQKESILQIGGALGFGMNIEL